MHVRPIRTGLMLLLTLAIAMTMGVAVTGVLAYTQPASTQPARQAAHTDVAPANSTLAGHAPDPIRETARGAASSPMAMMDAGDNIEVFTNTWSYSTLGMVYDPDRDVVRYAHESQSSAHHPTVYDVDPAPAHTVVLSFALSTINSGWPWQLDNRDGAGYDASTGTYFLADYNGDLSYSDDNIVEIDANGNILNAWEMDNEVGSNDSADGSKIDEIIDIAVVPGTPTRYFATAAYDDNVVYEISLTKTGSWWTPNSWRTVATCTVPIFDATNDNLGIDYDAQNGVLYHSSWDTTTLVISGLDCNAGASMPLSTTFDCPGAGGYNSGVTFIEGANPPEVWVTDFSSDQTTRCEAPGSADYTLGWTKTVSNATWTPELSVTVETSETFQVVDVIDGAQPFTLTDTWDPARLQLADVILSPPAAQVLTASGTLTIVGGLGTPPTISITKTFLTQPCTWTETLIEETLVFTETVFDQRSFTVTKEAPVLTVSTDAPPTLYANSAVSFTLTYSNTGGYENDVVISATFPITAPLIYADPPADDTGTGPNSAWARWDVGDLAKGVSDAITLYLYATEAGIIDIHAAILNHVGEIAGTTPISLEATTMPAIDWQKTVDSLDWYPGISVTRQTSETFTVVDTITNNMLIELTEIWIPTELELTTYEVDATDATYNVTTQTGMLLLSASPNIPLSEFQITITKTFTVKTCSWPQTLLWEQVVIPSNPSTEIRPVIVNKTAPVLHIDGDPAQATVDGGETVTFTLTYSNTGGYDNAAYVTLTLPSEITVTAIDPSLDLGDLATGERGVITVTAEITENVAPATHLTVLATIHDHADIAHDVAIIDYQIAPPLWDKWVNTTAWSNSQTTPMEDGEVFSITDVISTGNDFVIVDRWLPNQLVLLNAQPTAGSVVSAAGRLTWTVSLNAPQTVTLTKWFEFQTYAVEQEELRPGSEPPLTTLWEELWIGGSRWEARPVILYKQPTDLAITKEVTPTTAEPGDTITYTLTFINQGTGRALDVTITDTLPLSVTVTGVSRSGAAITQTTASPTLYAWDVEDLDPGAGGVITLAVTLDGTMPSGLIANAVEIATSTQDEDLTNNVASASTAVNAGTESCEITNPTTGVTYPFCDICGSVTFAVTGTINTVTISFTRQFPSINGEGLPRQYKITALDSGGGAASGYTADLVLCYEDEELPIAGIEPGDENLLVAFRHTGGGIWSEPASQSTATGANTITVESLTAFSAWGIGIPDLEEPTSVKTWALATQSNAARLLVGIGALLVAIAFTRRRKRS